MRFNGVREKIGTVQFKTKHVFTEIEIFFLCKHSSDCCKPVDNFHRSEKVNFDNFFFASFLIAFIKEMIFKGTYSIILEVFLLRDFEHLCTKCCAKH